MSKLGNTKRRIQTALEVGAVDEGERRNSAEEGLSRPYPRHGKEREHGTRLGLLHLLFGHWWAHCNKQIHKEIKILIPPPQWWLVMQELL